MRQPKSTHEKRKLRLSPNKPKCNTDTRTHLMEFAFLPNSKSVRNKNRKILKKNRISLSLHCIKFVWHN